MVGAWRNDGGFETLPRDHSKKLGKETDRSPRRLDAEERWKEGGQIGVGGSDFCWAVGCLHRWCRPSTVGCDLCKDLRAPALARMATYIGDTGRDLRDRCICALAEEEGHSQRHCARRGRSSAARHRARDDPQIDWPVPDHLDAKRTTFRSSKADLNASEQRNETYFSNMSSFSVVWCNVRHRANYAADTHPKPRTEETRFFCRQMDA